MKTYHFDLILGGDFTSLSPDQFDSWFDTTSDKLCDVVYDDMTLGLSCGVLSVGVSREAESMEAAIASAKAQIEGAGLGLHVVFQDTSDSRNTS